MIPRWFNPLPIVTFDRETTEEAVGKNLTDKEWWLIREWTIWTSWCFVESMNLAYEDNSWDTYMMDLELDIERVNPSPRSSKN